MSNDNNNIEELNGKSWTEYRQRVFYELKTLHIEVDNVKGDIREGLKSIREEFTLALKDSRRELSEDIKDAREEWKRDVGGLRTTMGEIKDSTTKLKIRVAVYGAVAAFIITFVAQLLLNFVFKR